MALLRPMLPRDPQERHRASTSLELLFDLVTVIAIATAAAGLHHAIANEHILSGIFSFLAAFFAIWWAWMNYTWFASAYNNDDVLFRIVTAIIMFGSLVLAAGVESVFTTFDLKMTVIGYVIMRLGMVALWLRAAKNDTQRRSVNMSYAIGISIAQLFWIGFLLLQPLSQVWIYTLLAAGIVIELSVPAISERKIHTPWHREHIMERYGLVNIIVLGETLLAGGTALRFIADGSSNGTLVYLAISALVIVVSIWWLYFSEEEQLPTGNLKHALTWGYGHFIIFAAGAGIGAGFSVLVDIISGESKASIIIGNYAIAIPIALYMLGLWFVRDRFNYSGISAYILPFFAVIILLLPLTSLTIASIAVATALSVFTRWYFLKYIPSK